MPRLLLIDPSRSAIEREAGEALLAGLRHAELEVEASPGTPGPAWLDRQLAACTGLVLIEPLRWWPRSREDRLRRVWLDRITAHVEFDRRNRLGRVAAVARGRASNPEFSGLCWFRWRGEWEALLDWAAIEPAPSQAFDFDVASVISGDRRRDDLLDAIDRALASARQVLVRGSQGAGKTRLLRDWVRRAGPNEVVAHHFALPEHGATQDVAAIRRSLARQLDPNSDDLDAALTRRVGERASARAVLVVDGLERIADPDSLLTGELAERVRWLIGARPGPGPREATIDLDAQPWSASQRALSLALATEVTRLSEPEQQALVERAAGNPGYVAAVAEEAGARTTKPQLHAMTKPSDMNDSPALPRRIAYAHALALGRLVDLPLVERRRGERILDLLALSGEPLPAAILLACSGASELAAAIDPVRELVRVEDPDGSPTLAFVHPSMAELRQVELDDRAALERALLEGIARAERGLAPAAIETYEATHASALRRRLGAELSGSLADVEALAELVRSSGPAALERELEAQGEGPAADILAIVRAKHGMIGMLGWPGALSTSLWNGLIDRGWTREQLLQRLRWPGGKPTIQLQHPLEHGDPCDRALPHPEDVHACAISSDGATLLTGCDDGRVRLWSRISGELIAGFEHAGLIRACALTPDGRWAVSASTNGTIKRWDLRTRQLAGACELGKSRTISALAIDPSGRRVLAGDDAGNVSVWRTDQAKPTKLGSAGRERVGSVAISASGGLGLSASGRRATIWDLDAERKHASPPDHDYQINAVVFGPAENSAYSLAIGESRRFALPSGTIEERYGELSGNLGCCVGFDEGKRILVARGKQLAIWDMVESREQGAMAVHAEDIEACACTPEGRWLVASAGPLVKVFAGEGFGRPANAARWSSERTIVAASPTGRRAIVGGDEFELSVVDLASGVIIGTLAVGARTNAVAWIDDDRLLRVGASDHEVAIWSVTRREKLAGRKLGDDWLRGCAISPDRRSALVGGDQKKTWLIDLDDLEHAPELGSHPDWVHACRFSSDGELALAVDRDAELRVWSLADRAPLHRLKSGDNYSYAALATIGALAFAGGTSRIDVWDIESGRACGSHSDHAGKINALALADEGRVLISAGDDATLRLWKVGRELRSLAIVPGHAPFTSVALAGPQLLAGDAAGNLWVLVVDWRALLA
ncbi:AAA family ATPase [Nannocystaceae bacterium ST9]